MHKITKEFECDYGHRVHNQSLNKEYSLDDCLVCRHLHGHRMKVGVGLEADTLTDNMVTDFKHLNWFKDFIDTVVDHKFIIDINDPMFEVITGKKTSDVRYTEYQGATFGYFALGKDLLHNEILESFVIVDFVPTSEELSKWFFHLVSKKMNPLGVKVSSISFKETQKSEAVYGL